MRTGKAGRPKGLVSFHKVAHGRRAARNLPITPGLTKEERQTRWNSDERMAWPSEYFDRGASREEIIRR